MAERLQAEASFDDYKKATEKRIQSLTHSLASNTQILMNTSQAVERLKGVVKSQAKLILDANNSKKVSDSLRELAIMEKHEAIRDNERAILEREEAKKKVGRLTLLVKEANEIFFALEVNEKNKQELISALPRIKAHDISEFLKMDYLGLIQFYSFERGIEELKSMLQRDHPELNLENYSSQTIGDPEEDTPPQPNELPPSFQQDYRRMLLTEIPESSALLAIKAIMPALASS